MSRPASRGPDLVALLAGGVAAIAFLPAILAGLGSSTLMRSRRLAWSWSALACLPAAALAVLVGPASADRLGRLVGGVDPLTVASALGVAWLPWLVATPLIGVWWHRRRDRRDRLHGGKAEQRLTLARGPLAVLRGRRRDNTFLTDAGMLLGRDERGMAVRLARPRAHVTVVGASGSGKTTTARLLLAAQAGAGGAVVVLDGKGGRELPEALLPLAEHTGRPVRLWSPTAFDDPQLDALRVSWNPCSDASATEVKDRIATAEPQTEPYYAALASRGLLAVATALELRGEPITLPELAGRLDKPKDLSRFLSGTPTSRLDSEAGWAAGLTEKEASALRGIATRLATMTACDPGRWLTRSPSTPELVLSRAIHDRELVCFTLPQGAFPELVPHVGRYLLAALNAIAGRIERTGTPADCLVLVDELSAFEGEQLAAGLERGRSAGLRYVLATQSLSNFDSSGGPKLAAAALDNAELVIIHRQADPDAAERLAGLAGTHEAWEHTHKVSDHHGHAIGWDEPGERARRLTNQYRAHPDTIKQLRTGEAIVVQTRPEHQVRRVRVRALRDATDG